MAAVSTLTDVESEVLRQKILRLLDRYSRKDLCKILDIKYSTLGSKIVQINNFTKKDEVKINKISI